MANAEYPKYEIRQMGIEDADAVIGFLERFFYLDSPIQEILQTNPPSAAMVQAHLGYLAHGISFKAVAVDNGRLLGVFLNKPLERPSSQRSNDNVKPLHGGDKYGIVVRFLNFLDAEAPLFERFADCERALEAGILSVDSACRGWGIGRKLLERTVAFGRDAGYPLVTCMCSSVFSGRLCERIGFEEICRYRMSEWEDVGGAGGRPLQVNEPNVDAVVYAMRL